MKFLILDIYPNGDYRLVKDTAGGYGTGNDFGNSFFSKLINKFVSKIVNVSDLDQIKLFTNKKLYIKNSDLPKLSDKEVYWHELKGMNVFVHKTNENLGVVKEMNNFGSDDCLVVASTKDSIDNKERLIPFIKDKFINHIDKTNKIIYVDWQKDFWLWILIS